MPIFNFNIHAILCSAILLSACGINGTGKNLPNGSNGSPFPTNTPENIQDRHKPVERWYAIFRTAEDSPAEIVHATNATRDYDFGNGIEIEVRNNTEKEILGVQIGISAPPKCLNYYSAGDTVIDSRQKDVNGSPLGPSSTILIHVPPDVAKVYLSPKQYKDNCPPDVRMPEVYVWGVEFADGSKWERTKPANLDKR